MSAAGVAFIEAHAEKPFFLFLHYYDPHHEYRPPEPYASRFPEHPYAGEIAYTGAAVGDVIEALRARGLYDQTLVIVTSDHGEEFGEHGKVGWHSHSLYDELLRVPLLLKLPDSRHAGTSVEQQVRGLDILPTLLELVGVEIPEQARGRSLLGLLTGGG